MQKLIELRESINRQKAKQKTEENYRRIHSPHVINEFVNIYDYLESVVNEMIRMAKDAEKSQKATEGTETEEKKEDVSQEVE